MRTLRQISAKHATTAAAQTKRTILGPVTAEISPKTDELNSHSIAKAANPAAPPGEPRSQNGPQTAKTATIAANHPRHPLRIRTSGSSTAAVALTPAAATTAETAQTGRLLRKKNAATANATPNASGCALNAVS